LKTSKKKKSNQGYENLNLKMKGLLFCGVFFATVACLAWAAPAIPSEIAARATELATSVIQLTESARQNPTEEQFDAAMNELVEVSSMIRGTLNGE
jgi:hypothetical protein